MSQQHLKTFLVWFDLACDDVLVLEPEAMTAQLKHRLSAEGAHVLEVQATDRKDAVKQAFPNQRVGNMPLSLLRGGVRDQSRLPH